MGAPITHVEINSNQQKKLLDFYAKLFDWHMDTSNPMGYAMVDTHAGKGIGAGIGQPRTGATTS
jgi:predicted enzyme related to lactoylglutathione lyase